MPSLSIKHRRFPFHRLKKLQRLNLCKILLAALPTIVFGVFTIVFTLQQDASARATREQDQRQEDETNQRTLFKEYIDDMTKLLLDQTGNRTMMEKTLRHIRVQTLTVLQGLDATRKRSVIVFLYENQLLRSDIVPNVDLRGANLNDLRFWSSSSVACLLPFLYLPGIYAENIIFDHCLLNGAVFDRASMVSAKFLGCSMQYVGFVNTNLTSAQFHGSTVFRVNFSGAYLTRSSIVGGTFRKTNLTNTDLYQSDISQEFLHPSKFNGLGFHTYLNTRYPNGSFSSIDKQNLIQQNQSEFECPSEVRLSTNTSECLFLTEEDDVFDTIVDIRQYSLLIDLKQARFSLFTSIRFNILNNNDEVRITVQFILQDDIIEENESLTVSKKNDQLVQSQSLQTTIPVLTRSLSVVIECLITKQIDQFCLFDDVNLFISEQNFSNPNGNSLE